MVSGRVSAVLHGTPLWGSGVSGQKDGDILVNVHDEPTAQSCMSSQQAEEGVFEHRYAVSRKDSEMMPCIRVWCMYTNSAAVLLTEKN